MLHQQTVSHLLPQAAIHGGETDLMFRHQKGESVPHASCSSAFDPRGSISFTDMRGGFQSSPVLPQPRSFIGENGGCIPTPESTPTNSITL